MLASCTRRSTRFHAAREAGRTSLAAHHRVRAELIRCHLPKTVSLPQPSTNEDLRRHLPTNSPDEPEKKAGSSGLFRLGFPSGFRNTLSREPLAHPKPSPPPPSGTFLSWSC